MALDIWFAEDIRNALTSLAQSNKQAMTLAELYGMNPEAARLCHEIYSGALGDVALAFGIAPQVITGKPPEELAGTVRIPARFAAAREP